MQKSIFIRSFMKKKKRLKKIKRRLEQLPDKLRSWNGIIFHEDIWIDKVMAFGSETRVRYPQNLNVNNRENDSKGGNSKK